MNLAIKSLKIRKKTWLSKDVFGVEFHVPGIIARPGQFFQVRISPSLDPFLNRPISIASYRQGRLLLIVKVRGKGTRLLGEKNVGETITLLGPMGKGLNPRPKKSLFLAGGIGIAPLFFLAQQCRRMGIRFALVYGTKHPNDFILKKDLVSLADRAIFVSEYGNRPDTVISAVRKMDLADFKVAYACGPKEMLRELQRLNLRLPIYAFCEDFLGCGCGLCLGCAIMYRGEYKRICTDGPVFLLEGIKFEG